MNRPRSALQRPYSISFDRLRTATRRCGYPDTSLELFGFGPFAGPVHVNEILRIADNTVPFFQPAKFVDLLLRNDLEDLPLADHLHGIACFENLVEDAVDVFAQLGSRDLHASF